MRGPLQEGAGKNITRCLRFYGEISGEQPELMHSTWLEELPTRDHQPQVCPAELSKKVPPPAFLFFNQTAVYVGSIRPFVFHNSSHNSSAGATVLSGY